MPYNRLLARDGQHLIRARERRTGAQVARVVETWRQDDMRGAGRGQDEVAPAVADHFRAEVEREAKEHQRQSEGAGKKGAKVAQPLRVEEVLAAKVGMSGRTLEKATAVVRAADFHKLCKKGRPGAWDSWVR